MISQDGDCVYLLFSKMGPGYLEYLESGKQDGESFLSIQVIGPWNITLYEDVQHLVVVICAICLVARGAAPELP